MKKTFLLLTAFAISLSMLAQGNSEGKGKNKQKVKTENTGNPGNSRDKGKGDKEKKPTKASKPGMEGPKCSDIREVLEKFDFDAYDGQGRVDYTVGVPWPGGGVYIVGENHDDVQHFLLDYYKVSHKRPYYLFFRPYHLCHIETPRAIAQAYFDARPVTISVWDDVNGRPGATARISKTATIPAA